MRLFTHTCALYIHIYTLHSIHIPPPPGQTRPTPLGKYAKVVQILRPPGKPSNTSSLPPWAECGGRLAAWLLNKLYRATPLHISIHIPSPLISLHLSHSHTLSVKF